MREAGWMTSLLGRVCERGTVGVVTYANGDKYSGMIYNGQKSGRGEFTGGK